MLLEWDKVSTPLLLSVVFEVLVTTVRQEKDIKEISIWKEKLNSSLFVDGLSLYLKDTMTSNQKTFV